MIAVTPRARPALSPVFWILFWGTLVNRAASFVAVFLALHLTQTLGMSKATAGWIVGCWGLGSWIASPIAGALTDRTGRRPTMLFGLVSNGVLVLAIAFVSDSTALFALAFLGGATQQLYIPASNAAVAFAMVWGMAMTLSPVLGGLMIEQLGAPSLWLACLAVGLAVGAGHLLAAPARRRRLARLAAG